MGYLKESDLYRMGVKNIGKNVLISDKCSLYVDYLEIGNNVRIDDFCVLTGQIRLGNNIHIGAYSALYGKYGIIMEDFTGLSPRCTIFSASDDFSGDYLISPMTPDDYTNVTGGCVILRKFSQVGSGAVIMPEVVVNEGAVVGAMSFIKRDIPSFEIWGGNPVHYIKKRNSGLVKLSEDYINGL